MQLLKKSSLFSVLILLASIAFGKQKKAREYYQLETYHYTTAQQATVIDNYLQNAYLPALHKQGIANIGVFKPIANDTAAEKIVYVLVPFKSWKNILKTNEALQANAVFQAAGSGFLNAPYDTPAYKCKEITLIKAFAMAPAMELPALTAPIASRVYELRNYEGPTDSKYQNKVKMFNEGGEVVLFKKLGFNAIFYGEVLAGSRMPNLMYMTSFNSRADRDAHWEAFFGSPEWKTLSALAEYQHNVKRAEIILTRPATYSDY